MKFTILYGRKFRVAAYDMLEISMAHNLIAPTRNIM